MTESQPHPEINSTFNRYEINPGIKISLDQVVAKYDGVLGGSNGIKIEFGEAGKVAEIKTFSLPYGEIQIGSIMPSSEDGNKWRMSSRELSVQEAAALNNLIRLTSEEREEYKRYLTEHPEENIDFRTWVGGIRQQQLKEVGHFEANQDDDPAAQEVLSKVVDLIDPNNENIVFHTLGFGNRDRVLAGGILNSEKALSQGLVSKEFGDRIGIVRSTMGSQTDNPFLNEERYVSVYPARFFRLILGEEKKQGLPSAGYFAWTFVCRLIPNQEREGFKGANMPETQVVGRLKPKDIIGIRVDPKVLEINIKDYFKSLMTKDSDIGWDRVAQTRLKLRLVEQLTEISTLLQLDLPTDLKSKLESQLANCRKLEEGFQSEMRSYNRAEGEAREQKEDYNRDRDGNLVDDKAYLGRMIAGVETFDQIAIGIYDNLSPYIYNHPRFAGVESIKDYLIFLGQRFQIPIHEGTSLLWPRKMNHLQLTEFLSRK